MIEDGGLDVLFVVAERGLRNDQVRNIKTP